MLAAGKLRHRVVIQKPVETQDTNSGAINTTWQDLATVWAAIEPLSVKELIASQTEDSKLVGRVTIRYRSDIDHSYRIYHDAKGVYYNIEGILADKESGLEYITIPVSQGLKY
jgi:SPP1 family predicted phage head-tail adaptor